MTQTLRERMTLAVLARLTDIAGLPPTPARDLDQPDTEAYVLPASDSAWSHYLALLDDADVKRREDPPLIGGPAPIYEWELTLTAAYAVRALDADTRRDQREVGIVAISEAVLPGAAPDDLGGLANLVWIDPYQRSDGMSDGNVPLAVAMIPIVIWFSAANPSA